MNSNLSLLFPGFSKELISEIEKEAFLQEAESGTTLMRTGQYFKNTVLITEGKIKIYREDDNGNEFFMYHLHPGQACALSMICATQNQKSQIMAKVVEDASLLMIPLQFMDRWMMEHRSWYEFVVDSYRKRFEEVLEVVDSIAFRSMDERLEFYIKRHRDACGCNAINLSHQEIASELNTSREVISRLLKKMEQRGLVKLNRNQIELFI